MAKKRVDPDPVEALEEFIEVVKKDIQKRGKILAVGIDPGTSGGIAFIVGKSSLVVDMPVVKLSRTRRVTIKEKDYMPGGPKTKIVHGETSDFELDTIVSLFKLLYHFGSSVRVGLEKAKPMVQQAAWSKKKGFAAKGGQNVRTAFQVGCGYAMWPLFLRVLGFSCDVYEPAAWKKIFTLTGKDKEASRLKAKSLFPSAPLEFKGDHGRAEALLLAELTRRNNE